MQGHSSIFIFGIDISPLLNQNLTILIGPRPQLLTVVLYRRRSRFSIDIYAFGQVPFGRPDSASCSRGPNRGLYGGWNNKWTVWFSLPFRHSFGESAMIIFCRTDSLIPIPENR